ncbi:MAG TPA: demethylmenaquinone methyltransferase [Streptosporangiaceae bacterium]|jgi:demethylmenaquinone methyltransferase/2-methoxy-6-polyprenyl-1,4-benzoquinol methylase|nr:demethylmenaquinone methyltransferase [Streptosporangiaceae bacterium]
MARADLDKRPGEVAAMFDELAGRYDLLNDLLSAGQVRFWRRVVARAVDARPGERVLDLAAGTGTSTVTFATSGADCVACDFSIGMLRAGISRVRADPDGPQPAFVGGDAVRLPFGDGLFDAVTISFGLRNVTDTKRALAEMLRVTRPGGRLVICEFSQLTVRPLRILYERYLARALPAVARRVSRNPAAYDYLAESIVDWPGQAELARLLHEAGWSAVEWRNLTLGIVAVHVARRPA